jgi:hypothetical protein
VHLYPPPQDVVLTRTRRGGWNGKTRADRREPYRMLHPNY